MTDNDTLWKLLDDLEQRAARGELDGAKTFEFTPPLAVTESLVYERFPGGSSVAPPPPGYAPPDAAGAYIADRPWGQIWFAFLAGGRLAKLSICPGMHGSPGV